MLQGSLGRLRPGKKGRSRKNLAMAKIKEKAMHWNTAL